MLFCSCGYSSVFFRFDSLVSDSRVDLKLMASRRFYYSQEYELSGNRFFDD